MEARKWLQHKETFLEYAMAKLSLMHNLNLDDNSIIHLMISGIQSRSLRETAASLNSASIYHFLNSMHQITSVSADINKRFAADAKSTKSKDAAGTSSSKGSTTKQNGRDNQFCIYCKQREHV